MPEMTISQALRRIKKLKGQLAEHRARAANSVSYKKSETPAFAFATSVEQANVARKELVKLQAAVSVANANTTFEWDGRVVTLCEATRLLDEYKSEIAWLKTLAVKAQGDVIEDKFEYDHDVEKHVRKQEAWKCDLPEAQRAALVDKVQKQFDDLNDLVETTNHKRAIGVPL